MERKLRVLYCLAYASQANGVVTFVKNYLSEIYKDIEASVVCGDNDLSESFKTFCEDRNIPLYLLPNPYDNGPLKYIKAIKRFFEEHHDFDVVHCNIPNYGMFYLKAAKKYDIKVRIMHSHNNKVPHKFFGSVAESVMERVGVKAANCFVACSDGAGKYLFREKRFTVIPNCIDYSNFSFDSKARNKLRKDLSIGQHEFVILSVGRLENQKNPLFALDVFKCFSALKPDSSIVFVGNGYLKNKLENIANAAGIGKNVKFIPSTTNVSEFYSAADCFISTSYFEGFGLSILEAQASGLECFISSGGTSDVVISERCHILDLNVGAPKWAEFILRGCNWDFDRKLVSLNHKFDIKSHSQSLLSIYEQEFLRN